jgi:hypothetical protein
MLNLSKMVGKVPGMLSKVIKKVMMAAKKHPWILLLLLVVMMAMGKRPSDLLSDASSLFQGTTSLAADAAHMGVDAAKDLTDVAADAAVGLADEVEGVAGSLVHSASRKKQIQHMDGQYHRDMMKKQIQHMSGEHQPGIMKRGSRKNIVSDVFGIGKHVGRTLVGGGGRKALSMPSGGGLYGSSADVMSACGGFGTDRYQCSTMNLPVSHSVRPHPLVSSKEIDTHYDGRTGLGPVMSSAFYDNKRFSACH